MLKLFVTVQMMAATLVNMPADLKARRERGSLTLEQAVIAGFLFVAAVAALGVIVSAINTNLGKIGG